MSRDMTKKKAHDARRHKERMATDLDYRLKRVIATMRARCLTGNGRIDWEWYGAKNLQVTITVEELKAIWFRDNAASMVRPDCDRKESHLGYTPGNIQFIEHADNLRKMIATRRPRRTKAEIRESARHLRKAQRIIDAQAGL